MLLFLNGGGILCIGMFTSAFLFLSTDQAGLNERDSNLII